MTRVSIQRWRFLLACGCVIDRQFRIDINPIQPADFINAPCGKHGPGLQRIEDKELLANVMQSEDF